MKMIRGCFLVIGLASALSSTSNANSIVRTLDPCISPDGSMIAFSWQGDIWMVASGGGMAHRLTVHPAEDTSPKWSPDGQTIYFASNRFGSLDIFSMSIFGTNLKRLTFDSASEYPWSVTPDGRSVYGYTTAFGRMDVFHVNASGGEMIRDTAGLFELEYYPAVSPDGSVVAYNSGGAPGNWRKPGHSGSNTARIWVAKRGTPLRESTMLYAGDRNDLFPTFLSNDTLAFVSNRSGAPNIWTGSTKGGGFKQLTRFLDGTIRAISATKNGEVVAFQKDSRIYTMQVGSNDAIAIEIQAPEDSSRDATQELILTTGVNDFAVSPNGKRLVAQVRGDLFLMPERGGTTRQLTTSPGLDQQPSWLDDKSIVYVAAGKNGLRAIKTVTIEGFGQDLVSDAADLTCPTVSPDRKLVAFHRGNREILVVPAAGGKPVVVATGDFGEAYNGGRSFNWSPDSQFLVFRSTRQRGIRVAMVKNDGSGLIEITSVGKSCSTPVFSSDGKSLIFSAIEGINYSESRDSKSPITVIDLVPQPITFSEDDLDKIDAPKEDPPKDVSVKVVMKGLSDRKRVLEVGDVGAIWPGIDGRTVFANIEGQFSTVDLKTGSVKPATGVTGAVSGLEIASNKQKIYFLQAGRLSGYVPSAGVAAPISFNAQLTVNMLQEERSLFEEIWWAMDKMYYNSAMNNKDWAGIREKFSQILPGVQSRDDFYALMGEMLELLDSSHLGANGPGGFRPTIPDDTSWLGVEWDWSALAARGSYVVASVVPGSPADNPGSELMVGDRIVSINSQKPSNEMNVASLLNRMSGKKVRLEVMRNDKSVEVLIQPARAAAKTPAWYNAWVKSNKEMVNKLSGGRLGYIHIQSMDVPSLDTFLREIYTDLDGKEGVLIDVRYNGGGFTSHIILNTMLKKKWLIRTNRDDVDHSFSENSYRGNALEMPAACLTNQYSFSNAEIFSEGFRTLQLGPIIGEPTAGGVIGTGAYGLWDGGSIRMPGSGAFTVNGENLERNGRKPDFDIRWTPNDSIAGRDPHLERAVNELLSRIKKVGSQIKN